MVNLRGLGLNMIKYIAWHSQRISKILKKKKEKTRTSVPQKAVFKEGF